MKEIIQLFSTLDQKKDPTFDQMSDMICKMAGVDKLIDFGEILLLMFGESLEPENA